MAKILIVADGFPAPETASGDLRFDSLINLMARRHRLCFCALRSNGEVLSPDRHGKRLQGNGVSLGRSDFLHTLLDFAPDIIWFEFHYMLRPDFHKLIRKHRPRAKVVVDSVDVTYNQLESRARLTGSEQDWSAARQRKERELASYALADLVVAVSQDDARRIGAALPSTSVAVIPNLHQIPAYADERVRAPAELVFVGNFRHPPNVDAAHYLALDIFPRIQARCGHVRLKLIGSAPPEDVRALAGEAIEVLADVSDLAPHLNRATVSVAPLRWGGGMKGKVGEAMSYALPVVTTSFGAEGFGLLPGEHLLVADTPAAFADCVLSLLENPALRSRIARSGYDFIQEHYSTAAVEEQLTEILEALGARERRPISRLFRRLYGADRRQATAC